jgi:CubicO group peptidase (beta-lactamase class C family)
MGVRRTVGRGEARLLTSVALLLAKGYGLANVEFRLPVTSETLFQIGSVTKAFTAAAVLSAAALAGDDLSVDTPVGTVVTGLSSCLQALTIGQHFRHGAAWRGDCVTADVTGDTAADVFRAVCRYPGRVCRDLQ